MVALFTYPDQALTGSQGVMGEQTTLIILELGS